MPRHFQDPAETPSLDLIASLEQLARGAGLTKIAHYLRMGLLDQGLTMNEDPRAEAASAATRMIERKMAEAVGLEPGVGTPAITPSLAQMVEEIHNQLKLLESKMEAGLKMVGTALTKIELRLDDAEARLTKIETFLHVPPEVTDALKNGSRKP